MSGDGNDKLVTVCQGGKNLAVMSLGAYVGASLKDCTLALDWWICEADEFGLIRCESHRCRLKENGGKVWPDHRSPTREIVWRSKNRLRLNSDPVLLLGPVRVWVERGPGFCRFNFG